MKECTGKRVNMEKCNCSYPGCPRKGMCCECLRYHLSRKELPACCFPEHAEKSYDRSIENFITVYEREKP